MQRVIIKNFLIWVIVCFSLPLMSVHSIYGQEELVEQFENYYEDASNIKTLEKKLLSQSKVVSFVPVVNMGKKFYVHLIKSFEDIKEWAATNQFGQKEAMLFMCFLLLFIFGSIIAKKTVIKKYGLLANESSGYFINAKTSKRATSLFHKIIILIFDSLKYKMVCSLRYVFLFFKYTVVCFLLIYIIIFLLQLIKDDVYNFSNIWMSMDVFVRVFSLAFVYKVVIDLFLSAGQAISYVLSNFGNNKKNDFIKNIDNSNLLLMRLFNFILIPVWMLQRVLFVGNGYFLNFTSDNVLINQELLYIANLGKMLHKSQITLSFLFSVVLTIVIIKMVYNMRHMVQGWLYNIGVACNFYPLQFISRFWSFWAYAIVLNNFITWINFSQNTKDVVYLLFSILSIVLLVCVNVLIAFLYKYLYYSKIFNNKKSIKPKNLIISKNATNILYQWMVFAFVIWGSSLILNADHLPLVGVLFDQKWIDYTTIIATLVIIYLLTITSLQYIIASVLKKLKQIFPKKICEALDTLACYLMDVAKGLILLIIIACVLKIWFLNPWPIVPMLFVALGLLVINLKDMINNLITNLLFIAYVPMEIGDSVEVSCNVNTKGTIKQFAITYLLLENHFKKETVVYYSYINYIKVLKSKK